MEIDTINAFLDKIHVQLKGVFVIQYYKFIWCHTVV